MIIHNKKVTIALLISFFGLGSMKMVQGMEETQIDETLFLVNEERVIERFSDSGKELAEKSDEIVGQDFLNVYPYQFMGTPDRKRLTDTFSEIKKNQQKREFECEYLKMVFKTKFIPMKDTESKMSYLISVAKTVPTEVQSQCEIQTLSDQEFPDSINKGLEKLKSQSPDQTRNEDDTVSAFIFVGPPGSGKGTLSSLCVKNFACEQLSTGNLCRQHISEKTAIGKQIEPIIKSGGLISDEVVTNMVDAWLETQSKPGKSLILDGYPRTIAQAQALNKLLASKYTAMKLQILRLIVSDECVMSRLNTRYVCSNDKCQAVYSLAQGSSLASKDDKVCDACKSPLTQRKDDTQEAIQDRINIYHSHENTLLSFFKDAGYKIVEVDASKAPQDVFESFKQLVPSRYQILK